MSRSLFNDMLQKVLEVSYRPHNLTPSGTSLGSKKGGKVTTPLPSNSLNVLTA